ncbi:MAG TPA: type II/IV secretion system ATPase subunit [Methanocella sp.]
MDFNAHDAEKKNFYGLVKKRRDASIEEKKGQQDAVDPAADSGPKGKWDTPPEVAAVEQVLEQASVTSEPPAEPAGKPAHDFSAWAALGRKRKGVQPVETPAEAPPVEAEEPEELRKILSKTDAFLPRDTELSTVSDSPAATHSPAPFTPPSPASQQSPAWLSTPEERQDDHMINNSEISALRHSKTEEDILKEFNSIISKSQGADLKEPEKVEDKKKKRPSKARKKQPRLKVEFEPYDLEKHGTMAVFPGLPDYEEIERYWVIEPYSFVVVLYNESANTYLYYVCEPSLTVFEKELLEDVYQRLQDLLILSNIDVKADRKEVLVRKATEIIVDYIGKVDTKSYHKIIYYIVRDYLEFGKITPIMHDNFIEDISNNGFDTPIFLYHKNYENIMTNITFAEKQLDSFVIRLAQRCGKHISIAEPMIDATMPDGSRIQMTLGKEITTRGSTFTIRKFKEIPITPVDLIAWNTFSSETMAYLWLCIENNRSLIFSGGTASGKTSSLNAVALFIPPKAKVISLEDTRELKLPHQNWIPGLTRDSFTADGKGAIEIFALLKAALRQRPEYLLVGEVRGKEAMTLFQAMSTGHTTFSTMHADSVESAIHRLENPPISVPRTMITALDIISIQAQTYLKNKRVRRNIKLVEINDLDPATRNIRTNDVYAWNAGTDRFDRVGESRILAEIAQRRAWSRKEINQEITRRQRVLEYMVKSNIRDFHQVAAIIQAYAVKPDRVLDKLQIKD